MIDLFVRNNCILPDWYHRGLDNGPLYFGMYKMPVGVSGLAKKKMSHISKTAPVASKAHCAAATFGGPRKTVDGTGLAQHWATALGTDWGLWLTVFHSTACQVNRFWGIVYDIPRYAQDLHKQNKKSVLSSCILSYSWLPLLSAGILAAIKKLTSYS